MVVRRSWILIVLGLLSLVLIAFGYWLWRPKPQLMNYVPTNSHLIIGFGSDYLHADGADIGQIPLGSWRQQIFDYLMNQASLSPDQIQALLWSTDETATEQTMIVQLQHSVPKKIQEEIRLRIVGKSAPVSSVTWRTVVFSGSVVILTTAESYQQPKEIHSLATKVQPASAYVAWDRPWPKNITELISVAGSGAVTEQTEGFVEFTSRNTLRKVVVRLPMTEQTPKEIISWPSTDKFEIYLAGQLDYLVEMKKFQPLQPWYSALDRIIGQQYGLSVETVTKSFGPEVLFLLDNKRWLIQSSVSSLHQVASAMSGYLRPVIKRGTLPDGSSYRELVRSEGLSSTTTIANAEVRVWTDGSDRALYQFDQLDRSTISNNIDLIDSIITPQEFQGSWEGCLPTEKLNLTTMAWFQASPEQNTSTILSLPAPWKATGLLVGHSDRYQEYIFCLL